MRKKGAEGERAPRTRRGPRPLPEQQPGTSPPSSTPANRRRTPIKQLLRGGGGRIAVTPAARAAPPSPPEGSLYGPPQGGASARPAPTRQARGRGLPGPPPLRAARSGALPRTAARPERGLSASRSGARRRPAPLLRPQAAACPPPGRPPPAPLGPRPGLGAAAAPHPGSIHRGTPARPAGRGQGPADKAGQRRPGRKIKS